jgi:hypothetical protein
VGSRNNPVCESFGGNALVGWSNKDGSGGAAMGVPRWAQAISNKQKMAAERAKEFLSNPMDMFAKQVINQAIGKFDAGFVKSILINW